MTPGSGGATAGRSLPERRMPFTVFLIGFVIIFAVLTFLMVLMIAPFAQALTSSTLS